MLGTCTCCFFLGGGIPYFYSYLLLLPVVLPEVRISICPSIHPPTCPSVIIHPSIHLSICHHPSIQPTNTYSLSSCCMPGLLLFLPHQPCPNPPSPEELSFLSYDVILTSCNTHRSLSCSLCACSPTRLASSSVDGTCLHSLCILNSRTESDGHVC